MEFHTQAHFFQTHTTMEIVMISQVLTTKNVKLFGYDFRGHTRRTLIVGIAYGCPYYKGTAIFSLVFTSTTSENRLFPRKPLPLCKPIRFVQLGQESCPDGFIREVEGCR